MNSQEALLEHLRKRQSAASATPFADWAQTLQEWLQDLKRLQDRLRAYLSKPMAQGLLRLAFYPVNIHEPPRQVYQAPALRIETQDGTVVDVVPRARNVVGAMGRVDVTSGPATALLVRYKTDDWYFMRRRPGSSEWDAIPLDEESLASILMELLR